MTQLLPLPSHLGQIGREIAEMLRILTQAHSAGTLGERGFADLLLCLEYEKARPCGFTITASNTYDDWTVVLLRWEGNCEPCAAFEFLPGANVFRPAGTHVRSYAD